MRRAYVHGYAEREVQRLSDQAATLSQILHWDTVYPEGSLVLEAGCGVGAQTVILAKNSPSAAFTSVDISGESLCLAQARAASEGIGNVRFERGDIFNLPYAAGSFDHLFVCFVLEHLPNPREALLRLKGLLKPGGTATVIEGDHGSAYFHPDSACAKKAIQCLIDVQAIMGGDSLIGRRLYPLMLEAGFRDIRVSPRMVYVDSSKPELVEGFTKNTFIAMVEGVRDEALKKNLTEEQAWERGIRDLYETTRADGTFVYTFFKCVARK